MDLNLPILFCQDDNLYIKWKEPETHVDKMLLVGLNNKSGKLIAVKPPSEFRLLFPQLKNIPSEMIYLILCQSAELFMVITSGMGHLIQLCTLTGTIIWCNFITVSGLNFLAACDRNGTMYFGNFVKKQTAAEYFYWYCCNLNSSAITFLNLEEHSLYSDGNSTYCVNFELAEKEIRMKTVKLKYHGIVDITMKNEKVELSCCDGRTYTKNVSELINSKNELKVAHNYKNTMLPAVINALQINSEILRSNSNKIDKLNKYLEQINIAKSLIIKVPNNIVKFELKISASVENEDSILINVCIDISSDAMKFDFNWWKLKVSIFENNCENFMMVCPRQNHLNMKIPFTVHAHSIKSLMKGEYLLKLSIFLTMMHFVSGNPLCCIKICEQNLDVINFLTTDRICYHSSHPYQKVICGSSVKSNSMVKETFTCKIATEITRLLMHCKCIDIKNVENGNMQLWFLDIPVNLLFKQVSQNIIEVTIETTDNMLLIFIKHTLQLRLCSDSHSIILTNDIIKEAQFCKRVLDVETNDFIDLATINRLHEFVTNFLSKIVI